MQKHVKISWSLHAVFAKLAQNRIKNQTQTGLIDMMKVRGYEYTRAALLLHTMFGCLLQTVYTHVLTLIAYLYHIYKPFSSRVVALTTCRIEHRGQCGDEFLEFHRANWM